MQKIYIIAYSCLNLGDDLFIQTLIRRYPKVNFYLYTAPKYFTPFVMEPNLRSPSFLLYYAIAILKKMKLLGKYAERNYFQNKLHNVVRIGGSIFIEPLNWEKDLTLDCQSNKSKTFYIGANFGPYDSEEYYYAIKKQIADACDCCFRDTYSYELFQDLPSVRVAPDVLFGYKHFPEPQVGKGIGISVISLDNREKLQFMKEQYYETIAQFCEECKRKSIPVTLFSFCKQEGDEEAIEKILAIVKNRSGIEVCTYNGNIESFIDKLNECEYILATRFHAMILGWCMGKKVLPVIYSKKQTNVIEDVGYSGYKWNILAGNRYDARQLLDDCINNSRLNIEKMAMNAEKQFNGLDCFIYSI